MSGVLGIVLDALVGGGACEKESGCSCGIVIVSQVGTSGCQV